MQKLLERNIWKYALLLITNKRIVAPILGAYYLTIPNVTAKGIGIILLAAGIAGFIFEIPSGYVSDKIGHKQALVISRVFTMLSSVLFLVSTNLTWLILASIALSIGVAFLSGTGSAFMHETLRGLNREKDYAAVMGKISSLGFAIPIILMTLTPFLVAWSFKLPFAIMLVIDVIGFFTSITLTAPLVSPEDVKEISATNFKQVVIEAYRLNYFPIAVFSGITSGVLFAIAIFRAPYQTHLAIPIILFGVLFGIGRVFASLLLAYSGTIKNKITFRIFYKYQLIFYTLLLALLGITTNIVVVAIVFIILNAFQWGLSKIDDGYQLEIIKPSKFKATLLSMNSQIDSMIGALVSFGIGIAIDQTSYGMSFLLVAIGFLVVLTPLYLHMAKTYKLDGSATA